MIKYIDLQHIYWLAFLSVDSERFCNQPIHFVNEDGELDLYDFKERLLISEIGGICDW